MEYKESVEGEHERSGLGRLVDGVKTVGKGVLKYEFGVYPLEWARNIFKDEKNSLSDKLMHGVFASLGLGFLIINGVNALEIYDIFNGDGLEEGLFFGNEDSGNLVKLLNYETLKAIFFVGSGIMKEKVVHGLKI